MRGQYVWLSVLLALSCVRCSTRPTIDNRVGRPPSYQAPGEAGANLGIGTESQDLVAMTDAMVRGMLTNQVLSSRTRPPRVIIDSEYFRNESSERFNRNLITDRLRVELNRAAQGRMVFVGRHYADMVEQERDLKRQGVVDPGSKGGTQAAAGGDYRLGGRITSLDAVQAETGTASRYHQIVFEMVDLETGVIVWSGSYEFKKSGRDDVIYR